MTPLRDHPLFNGKTTVGIISAENPHFPTQLDPNDPTDPHELMRRQLEQLGLKHEERNGFYNAPERSWMVYGPTREQMYQLGKAFGQESVVYSQGGKHELMYTNGSNAGRFNPGVGHEWFDEAPSNYYTHMPEHGGYLRLSFDDSTLHPSNMGLEGAAQALNDRAGVQPQQPQDTQKSEWLMVMEVLRKAIGDVNVRPHPHAYHWHDPHTFHHLQVKSPGVVMVSGKLGKAIADLEPGKETAQKPQRTDGVFRKAAKSFDYSHLLPPVLRKAYSLRLGHDPEQGALYSELVLNRTGGQVGYLDGSHDVDPISNAPQLEVRESFVDRKHRGKGLGKALYSAMFAHAYHHLGARSVTGDSHSSSAHLVHSSLARQHGLDYKGVRNPGRSLMAFASPGEFDEAYAPYTYQLKSELKKANKPQDYHHATAPGVLEADSLGRELETEPPIVAPLGIAEPDKEYWKQRSPILKRRLARQGTPVLKAELVGEALTEKDARKLASWWNAHHPDHHEVRPHDTNFQPGGESHKRFKVVRVPKDPVAKAEPGQHPHMDQGKVVPNDQAAGVGVSTYAKYALPYGTVTKGSPSNLQHYSYEGKNAAVDQLLRDHGYSAYYAGGKHGRPDLANRNYNTKHLMIYDPTAGSGGDFGHESYTDAWRKVHELAHALTYPELNKLYGGGRRIGKLGTHRTAREALRAVHWEHLAAHKQRELNKALGIEVPDSVFNKEYNTVMHDAVHRAVTGQFTEPAQEGFQPHEYLVPLEHSLGMVREAAHGMGLQGPHDTIKKHTIFKNET